MRSGKLSNSLEFMNFVVKNLESFRLELSDPKLADQRNLEAILSLSLSCQEFDESIIGFSVSKLSYCSTKLTRLSD